MSADFNEYFTASNKLPVLGLIVSALLFLVLVTVKVLMILPYSQAIQKKVVFSFYSADDMIISGDDSMVIVSLKEFLHQQFEMKDLGPLRYFLGIEVAYSPARYLLSQTKYCIDVIQ